MTTGQLIREARKRARMTQAELATKLGIPYQSVSQWERDTRNPKYDTLKRIAAALSVDWTELVPEEQQGPTVIEHIDKKLKTLPDIPEDTVEAISELVFTAGEASGQYKGLMAGLEPEVFHINRLLVQLNPDGKQKAVERVEELAEIPRYRFTRSPSAPSESTDTTPPPDGSERLPEGK